MRQIRPPNPHGGHMKKITHRLRIDAPDGLVDQITGILALEAGSGWQEQTLDEGIRFLIYFEKPERLEELAEKIRPLCPIAIDAIEIGDPLEDWKEFFTPVACGANFVVIPPWLAREDFPQKNKIIIEPKSAFGTGHHATTRLCLEELDRLLESGLADKNTRFLDLGCGSGVLGLACALSGMGGLGVDIDPVAIDNALENRALNKARLDLRVGGEDALEPEKFDLILANILAAPLIEMAPAIASALTAGGSLILSGILRKQAEAVAASFLQAKLAWRACAREGEWVALHLEKPALDTPQH